MRWNSSKSESGWKRLTDTELQCRYALGALALVGGARERPTLGASVTIPSQEALRGTTKDAQDRHGVLVALRGADWGYTLLKDEKPPLAVWVAHGQGANAALNGEYKGTSTLPCTYVKGDCSIARDGERWVVSAEGRAPLFFTRARNVLGGGWASCEDCVVDAPISVVADLALVEGDCDEALFGSLAAVVVPTSAADSAAASKSEEVVWLPAHLVHLRREGCPVLHEDEAHASRTASVALALGAEFIPQIVRGIDSILQQCDALDAFDATEVVESTVTSSESSHPHPASASSYETLTFPKGTRSVEVSFDAQCETRAGDVVRFYKDELHQEVWGERSGCSSECWEPLTIPAKSFVLHFNCHGHDDGKRCWGYKLAFKAAATRTKVPHVHSARLEQWHLRSATVLRQRPLVFEVRIGGLINVPSTENQNGQISIPVRTL